MPNTDAPPSLKTQRELADAWSTLVPDFPKENIHVLPSIEDTVNLVRKVEQSTSGARSIQVLATGSLHLVGGVMNVAELSELVM